MGKTTLISNEPFSFAKATRAAFLTGYSRKAWLSVAKVRVFAVASWRSIRKCLKICWQKHPKRGNERRNFIRPNITEAAAISITILRTGDAAPVSGGTVGVIAGVNGRGVRCQAVIRSELGFCRQAVGVAADVRLPLREGSHLQFVAGAGMLGETVAGAGGGGGTFSDGEKQEVISNKVRLMSAILGLIVILWFPLLHQFILECNRQAE